MSILDGLNPKQVEAVTALDGYIRVIAGAGSGKTKALTHRFAYLVREVGIQPRNILCVTFTNKAAGEMKRRVRQLLGDGYDTSLITTYHGFCVRVLREDIHRLFFPESFQILDTADQKNMLEEIYDQLEIKLDYATFEKMLEVIEKYKVDLSYVGLLTDPKAEINVDDNQDLNQRIIMMYLDKQRKQYSLDFSDLINFTFVMFDRYQEVRKRWQEQLHYVQVDEFQDSSRKEAKLIDILTEINRNLFVVGDPDQNIYEWRGADMGIIVDFDKSYPGAETVIMDQNYRSTPEILAVANSLISKNSVRVKKDLFTQNASGAPVMHLHAPDEAAEASWITKRIKDLVKAGHRYSGMAILYRSSFLSRFVEQALLREDIPYEMYGGVRFFERMEIRDALAYLRLVAGGDDNSFLRVVNVPKRKIGKTRVAYIKSIAADEGTSLYQALVNHKEDTIFRNTGAVALVAAIEGLRQQISTDKPRVSDLLQRVLRDTGYEQYIRENGNMERLDNIAELLRTVTQQEQAYGEEMPLELFLHQVSLQMEADDEEKRDCVKLMTIHTSKGLEFPVVFVVGMTDGIFPSRRTVEERKQAGLEEERRLCFVAFTRARERLYFTDSEGFGNRGAKKLPSRFVFDIDESLYKREGRISKDLLAELRKQINVDLPATCGASYETGCRVVHKVLGPGEVVDIDVAHQVYHIKFDKSGAVRPIAMDFAGLARQEEKETDEITDRVTDEVTDIPLLTDCFDEVAVAQEDSSGCDEPIEIDDNLVDVPPSEIASCAAPPKEWTDNLWERPDVPKSGWECVGVDDLGAPVGICGMCGRQIIRYVHHMRHPEYRGTVGAGCVCAGKMEGDVTGARQREGDFKKKMTRLRNYMKRPWRKTGKGNFAMKYKGNVITVLPDKFHQGKWKFVIDGTFSPLYDSRDDAVREAFYAFELMSAAK